MLRIRIEMFASVQAVWDGPRYTQNHQNCGAAKIGENQIKTIQRILYTIQYTKYTKKKKFDDDKTQQ